MSNLSNPNIKPPRLFLLVINVLAVDGDALVDEEVEIISDIGMPAFKKATAAFRKKLLTAYGMPRPVVNRIVRNLIKIEVTNTQRLCLDLQNAATS